MAREEEEIELNRTLKRLRLKIDVLRHLSDVGYQSLQYDVLQSEFRKQSIPVQDEFDGTFQALVLLSPFLDLKALLTQLSLLPPSTQDATTPPVGLLSLRDYSVIQAAIEVCLCWCLYPIISSLPPLTTRRCTKTLKISHRVLSFGTQSYENPSETDVIECREIVKTIHDVLHADQFKAMMLSSYLSDLLTCHIAIEQDAMVSTLLESLPLGLCIESLLGILRRPNPAAFKTSCSESLIRCVMMDGGVHATITTLVRDSDQTNTQLQLKVASLLCSTPKVVSEDRYFSIIAPQVLELLNAKAKSILPTMSSLIICRLAHAKPKVADKWFFSVLFRPLLAYEHDVEYQSLESELEDCLQRLMHLVDCPTFEKPFQLAFVPILRPILHLLARVHTGKLRIKQTVEAFVQSKIYPPSLDSADQHVVEFLTRSDPQMAAMVLLSSLLESCPPLRPSLSAKPLNDDYKRYFRAGDTGGIVLSSEEEPLNPEAVADGILSLADKKVDLGELFLLLLRTFAQLRSNELLESDEPSLTASHSFEQQMEQYRKHREELSETDTLVILNALIRLSEMLGPSMLKDIHQMVKTIHFVLKAKDIDQEIACISLGLLTTLVEAGPSERSKDEEDLLRTVLPDLERLSSNSDAQIAEMSVMLRASILARGVSTCAAPSKVLKTFDEIIQHARIDLASAVVPLRARGLVSLSKVVRSGSFNLMKDQINELVDIFMENLLHPDSYVYLAAVQGLSILGETYSNAVVPRLVDAVKDPRRSFEQRIKLSEALMFSARRIGEGVHRLGKVYVYAFLAGIRPPQGEVKLIKRPSLIEEVDPEAQPAAAPAVSKEAEPLAAATLRSSCLSNLAEVCTLLGWAIHPYVVDVVTCVLGVLQFETDASITSVAVRRGAVYLIDALLCAFGRNCFEIFPDYIKPLYDNLRWTRDRDSDQVVKYQTIQAIQRIDQFMGKC